MNIPAELMYPIIRAHVDARGISIEDFEASMDYGKGAVYNRITQYENFSFRMADRIFCKLGDPLGYWLSDTFKPYYDAEFEHECAADECDVRFLPHHEHQKYCSKECKGRQSNIRRETRRAQLRQLQGWNDARKRNKMTPEQRRERRRLYDRLYKREYRRRQRELAAA